MTLTSPKSSQLENGSPNINMQCSSKSSMLPMTLRKNSLVSFRSYNFMMPSGSNLEGLRFREERRSTNGWFRMIKNMKSLSLKLKKGRRRFIMHLSEKANKL